MTEFVFRPALTNAAQALQDLHGGLVVAVRRQYEDANWQRGESFTILRQMTDNPAFAWIAPLTGLVSRLSDLSAAAEPDAADAAGLARQAAALIAPAEGDDREFYEQLRDARTVAPELVTRHAHARAALGALRDALTAR